jgi:hypothetical protein
MSELKRREGGFDFPEHPIRVCLILKLPARVPVYSGRNLIDVRDLDEIARMMLGASGTSGRCRDYVSNLAEQMKRTGIVDPAVEAMVVRLDAAAALKVV